MSNPDQARTSHGAEWALGVVGCGRFARFVLESLRTLPGLRLAALASRTPANLEKAAAVWAENGRGDAPSFYHHPDDLLADAAVDIVLVMTPPHLHYALSRAVISRGRHLFLEKPGGLDPAGLAELARLADARGVAALIDFVMRYNPLVGYLRQVVTTNVLGGMERVALENEAHGDLPPDHWLWDAEKSGGLLVEHGVHFFDLVNWLAGTGKPLAAACLPNRNGPHLAPDRVLTVARHGGTLATYYHAFTRPSGLAGTKWHFTFERGFVELFGWIPERIEISVPEGAAGSLPSLPGAAVTRRHDGLVRVRAALPDRQEAYRAAIRAAFRDLLRKAEDPAHRPAVTLADGAEALRMAFEATRMTAADEAARLTAAGASPWP